jgi:hypothetical protein
MAEQFVATTGWCWPTAVVAADASAMWVLTARVDRTGWPTAFSSGLLTAGGKQREA